MIKKTIENYRRKVKSRRDGNEETHTEEIIKETWTFVDCYFIWTFIV